MRETQTTRKVHRLYNKDTDYLRETHIERDKNYMRNTHNTLERQRLPERD